MKLKSPIIIVGFSILIGILAAFVSFLPKIAVVKSEHEMKGNKQELSVLLSQTEYWKTLFFSAPDSSRRFLQIGNKRGVNSGFKWFSKWEGDGAFHLKLITEDSVFFEMITDNGQFREKGKLYFQQKDSLIKVVWIDSLDISTSLFSRIAAKKEGFTKRMEVQNTEVLKNLDKIVLDAKNRGAN